MTLQTAPLLPPGTTWTGGPGQYLATNKPKELWTHLTYWQGAHGTTEDDRPGSLTQVRSGTGVSAVARRSWGPGAGGRGVRELCS